MSEIFKKFKSIFIVEEGAPATAGQTAPPTTDSGKQTAPPVERQTAAAGSVTDKFMDVLMGALEKNNQSGFDYLEFRQALKNLAKMPMDETTRFQSAYAMAQTMGVTPEKLVESAKLYLNVLAQEQTRFNEAHAQQRSRLIGTREEEIKNLEASIQQKAEQIRLMTQQIEEDRQKSEQIRKEIGDSTVKIETTKADFETTFAAVAGQIEGDVAKIQQHLK